jgi:hypothetical protein
MNREERNEYNQELVPVELEGVLGTTPKALIVQVDGEKHFVGQSAVDNLDELVAMFKDDPTSTEDEVMMVPRWLAVENGWEADEQD